MKTTAALGECAGMRFAKSRADRFGRRLSAMEIAGSTSAPATSSRTVEDEQSGIHRYRERDRLSKTDQAIDVRVWADVARMWPRNWWSPAAQWRDVWLRHYARTKLRQLQKGASARR